MNYLLDDVEAEQRFQFRLVETVRQIKEGAPLLRGYSVHSTPSVKPIPQEIKCESQIKPKLRS